MEPILDIIRQWDTGEQQAFFTGVAITTGFVTGWLGFILFGTVRIVLRGYPPQKPKASQVQDCNHYDNLTDLCLKPGGCKTREECRETVAKAGKPTEATVIDTHDATGLLEAIARDPADDVPRLVYADWCEDNGDPDRAEFIRLQIQADREKTGIRPLVRKIATLLERNHTIWMQPFQAIVSKESAALLPEWRWSRGFISTVRLPLAEFMCDYSDKPLRGLRTRNMRDGVAARLFRAAPVERVELAGLDCGLYRQNQQFKGGWYCQEDWADWLEEGEMDADDLPEALYRLLDGFDSEYPDWKLWHDKAAADTAMLRAAVKFGRQQAWGESA